MSSYSVHGMAKLVHALADGPLVGGADPMLAGFLARSHAELAADAAGVRCPAACLGSAAALSKWFDGPRDVVEPAASGGLYLGSAYAFHAALAVAGDALSVEGCVFGGLAFAEVEGARLMFWSTKAQAGYPLYSEACKQYARAFLYKKEAATIMLPRIDLRERGRSGLEGLELGTRTVRRARYQHSLVLDGAVEAPPAGKLAVFDKPFAVAVIENQMRYVTFVAYIN